MKKSINKLSLQKQTITSLDSHAMGKVRTGGLQQTNGENQLSPIIIIGTIIATILTPNPAN